MLGGPCWGANRQGIARLGRVNNPVDALVVVIHCQGSLRLAQSFICPTIPQKTRTVNYRAGLHFASFHAAWAASI